MAAAAAAAAQKIQRRSQLHKRQSAMAVSRSLDTAHDHAKAAELTFSALSQIDVHNSWIHVKHNTAFRRNQKR